MLLGLSGGVDSALTLAVAVDALGRDRVRAVMMPSPYNAAISLDDARDDGGDRSACATTRSPSSRCSTRSVRRSPASSQGLPADATEENIQARIRGTLLMALSNKFGSIVLTTGNKSEMAVGYATLYGDMAGGFAVLKDISKTLVYRLCALPQHDSAASSPSASSRAPPSAELRPDQTDQDSLPPYDVLDGILERYVEHDQSAGEIVAAGLCRAERRARGRAAHQDQRVQAPAGGGRHPHHAAAAFGKDWRYPITSAWYEWKRAVRSAS